MDHRHFNNIHFLRLRGNYEERAKTHARFLRTEIKEGALPFLAKKNEWLIRRAPGFFSNTWMQNLAVAFYHKYLVARMRKSLREKDLGLLKIMAEESGLAQVVVDRAMFQADGLMALSRLSIMDHYFHELPHRYRPGCSSAVVDSRWSENGDMLVLRNQDYPVVGPWEKHTTVMFHEPTDRSEIPHVAIASAGLHTSGLTAMNREGITLAAHAHFGKHISLKGLPIFVVGNEIISRAKTIGQAADLARKLKRNANWALVISSAKENTSAVLEMTPEKVRVRYPEDGFLTHTNFFQLSEMAKEEALICGGRHEDDFARICRMQSTIRQNKGKITPELFMNVLGSHQDPWTEEEKIVGNTVSVMSTVKSVVFNPNQQEFWISGRGKSPMGHGPFYKINVDSFWNLEKPQDWEMLPSYTPPAPRMKNFYRYLELYRQAYMAFHMQADQNDYLEKAAEYLRQACEEHCPDGNVWLQCGVLHFKLGRFEEAHHFLSHSKKTKLTDYHAQVRNLLLARCLDVLSKRSEALTIYNHQQDIKVPKLLKAYKKGVKKPFTPHHAHNLMLDMQFIDPIQY